MLTEKDKKWLRGKKWRIKDIELLEKELKTNKVREPYYIRSVEGKNLELAEVKKFKGEQCLHIF